MIQFSCYKYITFCHIFSRILVKLDADAEIWLAELPVVVHYEQLVCSGRNLRKFSLYDLSKV